MAATTAAVVGIAGAVGSAAMALDQANKAERAREKAASEAEKAMGDARSRAEIDFYSGLTIPMDAYEAAYESNLATQKTALESLQEADTRFLAGGVGRLGAQAAARDEATRIAMGKEISDLERTKADSKDAINQQLIELDVANARQQNQMRADAELAKANAQRQVVDSITQATDSVASLAPLYGKNKQDREFNRFYKGLEGIGHEGVSEADMAAWYSTLGTAEKDIFRAKDNTFNFDKNTMTITGADGNQIGSYVIPSQSGYKYTSPNYNNDIPYLPTAPLTTIQ
tara:strand:+ start:849 stop:1703 length:855 start_codon:yes stop_codon:yes gene_type:complete